jgi:DNA-binding transcriptional LysR family regulator
MEIYQLKTFVTIAREGSITRASELLFLSQPAVSAHIKAIEDEVGFLLFERTPRGMTLTENGEKLLAKAEQMITVHKELIEEAKYIKGQPAGKLRLGSNRTPSAQALGKLLTALTASFPDIELILEYGNSSEILNAIRNNSLDAGFYTDTGVIHDDLKTLDVDQFGVYLATPMAWIKQGEKIDWQELKNMPWICPASNTCCGRVAENLFEREKFRPKKIVNVDQEKVTRTLIAGGVGLGFLHADTALDAAAKGEVILLGDIQQQVKIKFAVVVERMREPLISMVFELAKNHTLIPHFEKGGSGGI